MSGVVTFDHPFVLLGLAVFIPLILYDYFSAWRKQIQQNLSKRLRTRLLASRFFFRLFLACVVIALSGPRWGIGQAADEYRQQGRRAVDAVIALDVSRSMEVIDVHGETTRLERGLAIVRETVSALPGTRFAVAISRSRGYVTVPLTWDAAAVLAFLDGAGSSLTGRGTNLESLVDAALSAFQSSGPSTRVILLVSDGEALAGSLKTAVGRCKRDGIAISAIAVGSDEGGIVPGQEGVISSRDSGALRMAAGQTGGIYIDGNHENAARILIGHLRTLAPGSQMRETKKEAKPRWLLFIILGIMAFGASKASLLKAGEPIKRIINRH
ncbi:MAG: VWA domain-containing protein [Treponema sp.]|jgi:Ca-activated chloride channel family protein|nr:VWA domain-containing protein [Treponema sp.]